MIAIHPKIVYRVPHFSIHETLAGSWNELKSAIAESSPDFYLQIQNVESNDLYSLPPKIFATIWKYFNRAKFRATPYGSFAGVGLFNSEDGEEEEIVISNDQQYHHLIDWVITGDIERSVDKMIALDVLIQANGTYYNVGEVIRFIAKTGDSFSLSEVDSHETIFAVLGHCKKSIRLSMLIADLNSIPDIMELVAYLISNQLLITSLNPNVIGVDYFKRLSIEANPELPYYTIAERPHIKGRLDKGLLRYLPAAVDILNKINPPVENKRLSEFLARFTKKFEQNEVSLMTALDPELGVGYDDLEQSTFEDSFLSELLAVGRAVEGRKQSLSDSLIKNLLDACNPLISLDLEMLVIANNELSLLPNTMSALCYSSGENLVIESIGGCSANVLLGRFTTINDELHLFCKELTAIEGNANPEVLFFDIAYQSEDRVDNVNRRKSLSDFQLSILDYDTTEFPLALNDIYISVAAGEVILRSGRLNKRMIPRMATAYNYNRSDLSVFRLLCDLQHQKLNTSLSFSLQALFPHLNYYPRLTFKNIILSTRKWKVSFDGNKESAKREFRKILNSGCRFVRHGVSDQTLCFDLAAETDIEILTDVLKKHKTLYLEEMLVNDNGNISDESGSKYMAQFAISLFHKDRIYKGVSKPSAVEKADSIIQSFPAGSAWLYYQIFVHNYRADELLITDIADLLNDYRGLIDVFFFIRYNEDGNHIRLRLKVNEVNSLNGLLYGFAQKLNKKLNDGIISDIRICSYQREVQRYGWGRIEALEDFFYHDSQSTLAILALGISTKLKYYYTLQLIEAIRAAELFADLEFEILINSVSTALNKEHRFTSNEFSLLNENYKSFISELPLFQNHEIHFPLTVIVQKLISLLSGCENAAERQKLFTDLIHMHVNRLHASKQRMHEAVTYYFACKQILRHKRMEKGADLIA